MSSQERTAVSNAATALSEMFDIHCVRMTLPGDVARRPVLSAPAGMSTEGGKLARQHLTLEADGRGLPSITVGWVDLPSRRASLRTFGCLLAAHRARFGAVPFGVDGVAYERFLNLTRKFLVDQGFTIEMERHPPELGPPPPERPLALPVALGTAVLASVAALVAWWLWFR